MRATMPSDVAFSVDAVELFERPVKLPFWTVRQSPKLVR